MKSFIYTYAEHTPRGGHTQKTVRIYRLRRGYPDEVAVLTETFVSEFQLVMQALEAYRLLPPAAFARNQFGGYKYSAPSALFDAGFARVSKVI